MSIETDLDKAWLPFWEMVLDKFETGVLRIKDGIIKSDFQQM